jgi:hypothetical protein
MAEILRRGRLSLVTYDPDLLDDFLHNLSEANRREFRDLYNMDPRKELSRFTEKDFVYWVVRGSEPLALVGLSAHEGGVGCTMWTLFSENMGRYWISFVRASPALIAFIHSIYSEIEVSTWVENAAMHQWLAHLGFEPVSVSKMGNGEKLTDFVRCERDPSSTYAAHI